MTTMHHVLLALLLFLVVSGCFVGPRASKLQPARTGQGITVVLTTESVPALQSVKNLSAEVLEVREEGLLLRGHQLGWESIFRISYDAVAEARFDALKRLNFGNGEPPSPDQREELRLLSRFPKGVSDELLHRLLTAYNQNELRTVP